jgi:hypothetical protein
MVMKNVIVCLVALVWITDAWAQGCLPDGIEIYSQQDIDNFQINYPGCTEIEGYVLIVGNNITNLAGLNVVTAIDGYLQIYNNENLTSLTDLENLTSVGGLDLNSLAITSLSGLENLVSIGGDVIIWDDDSLTNLSGLQNITSIEGWLVVKNNDALTSLSVLENLTLLQGGLNLVNNDSLPSLLGLHNVDGESILSLLIEDNYLLSNCDVQSICDYLATSWGTSIIHDNASGCNSPQEVLEHCLTQVEVTTAQAGITIVPNPSKDKITISVQDLSGNTQLSIFTVSGKKVMEKQIQEFETQLDISALPRGVYFVRVQDEEIVEVGKIVKE